MLKLQTIKNIVLILSIGLILTANAFAQTTAFTYQGRFTDASVPQPTNGTYNMQFALFDAAANGNQIGVTVTIPAVQVVNGIFTVTLDYPAAASFDSSPRFLQLTVGNTVLSPRQEITSAPYAIRARNATLANDSNKLGGIEADQYVTGQVVRSVNNLTNNVTLAAGANITITPVGNTLTIASTGGIGSFIDNSTVQQPTSNFNISGGGTVGGTLSANIVNSTTNFRIGGATVFSTPNSSSVVAGLSANHATFSADSTFFGYQAGAGTSSLFTPANTFIGSEAGRTNSGGANNSFVGRQAGLLNSSGSFNSFFGSGAGKSNTTASDNSFFGYESGLVNSTGTRNSFFGFQAGSSSINAGENAFFGYKAGTVNVNGVQNTFVGTFSGLSSLNGASNSLFGYNADATGSKNTSLGADTNASGSNNTVVGYNAGAFGSSNTVIGFQAKTTGGLRTRSTAIGADAQVNKDNTIVLGTLIDTVEVPNELKAKNITVSNKVIAQNVTAVNGVFDSIRLTFTTTGGTRPMCYSETFETIGLCPIILRPNTAVGDAVPSDTVNQQQTQINLQAEQIKQQQLQIEALKQTVCAMNPAAKICGN